MTHSFVEEMISSSIVTLIVCTANWSKQSKSVLADIETLRQDQSQSLNILCLDMDNSDHEDISINKFQVSKVPSVIMTLKGRVITILSCGDATLENIKKNIERAVNTITPMTPNDIRKMVSLSYANTVTGSQSCCVSVDSTMNGYSLSDIAAAGIANLGLGCGNPLSFADLKAGEVVVDLGCGAGMDCFIASQQVGHNGLVIGVDMTMEMLHKAKLNAKENNIRNISFRLGEIEYLPVADGVADAVISNCVINLSPDKQQVIHDIYRVLRPGGRVAICDVVARENVILPDHLRTSEALAC